jgi:tripartite-type tricarboxylate transporter receptor subunit TctC
VKEVIAMEALQTPEIRERFGTLGLEPEGGGPERFATLIREDIERWRKVVKAGNVRTE